MTEDVGLVWRSVAGDADAEFDRRVDRQGEALSRAIEAGAFDNESVTLGLELEAYAVAETDDGLELARVPESVFEGAAAKELGVHNVELNADPTTVGDGGLDAQAEALAADLEDARDRAREHGRDVVLDAMWAVPPAEGTLPYLNDVTERDPHAAASDGDGEGDGDSEVPADADRVVVAENMRWDPRYAALDNEALRRAGGRLDLSVPGAELTFRSILFESLATSIQPHVQVPDADALPRYYTLAIRTLGPVLALATNSPFLPGDCYDVDDPEALLAETHHELRIAAFEQSMNQRCRKVAVPRDLHHPTDAVECVVGDDTFAPFLREWIDADAPPAGAVDSADPDAEALLEACWEFDYKRSTFWRWVRPVVGGDSVQGACGERSLRIEYRPLPTQPTVRDVVGLQALTVGLIHGLATADHPLADLPWAAAEMSFYSAVEDGPGADLTWIDSDGERTTDRDRIYEECFAYARDGLADLGVDAAACDRYLDPIEARREHDATPSTWKIQRVREAVADGADLPTALERMQREYVEMSREHETFVDWL